MGGNTWSHRIEVQLSFPGHFQTIRVTEGEKSAFRALAARDLDGGGSVDLAAVQEDGSVRLFRGSQDLTFTLALVEPATRGRTGCSGYDIHLVDVDGDGRLEIIASFAGEPTGVSFEPVTDSGGGIQAWRLHR